jgi:hypothetical protein
MTLKIYQTGDKWRAVLYNSKRNQSQIWNSKDHSYTLTILIEQCHLLFPELTIQRYDYDQYCQTNTYSEPKYETNIT